MALLRLQLNAGWCKVWGSLPVWVNLFSLYKALLVFMAGHSCLAALATVTLNRPNYGTFMPFIEPKKEEKIKTSHRTDMERTPLMGIEESRIRSDMRLEMINIRSILFVKLASELWLICGGVRLRVKLQTRCLC